MCHHRGSARHPESSCGVQYLSKLWGQMALLSNYGVPGSSHAHLALLWSLSMVIIRDMVSEASGGGAAFKGLPLEKAMQEYLLLIIWLQGP